MIEGCKRGGEEMRRLKEMEFVIWEAGDQTKSNLVGDVVCACWRSLLTGNGASEDHREFGGDYGEDGRGCGGSTL